jgi:hypothetical protein
MVRDKVPWVKLAPPRRCAVLFVDLQRLLDAFDNR